jgi:hypothetical protein
MECGILSTFGACSASSKNITLSAQLSRSGCKLELSLLLEGSLPISHAHKEFVGKQYHQRPLVVAKNAHILLHIAQLQQYQTTSVNLNFFRLDFVLLKVYVAILHCDNNVPRHRFFDIICQSRTWSSVIELIFKKLFKSNYLAQ